MCAGTEFCDQRNDDDDSEGSEWKEMVHSAFWEGEDRLEEGCDPRSDIMQANNLGF